MMPSAVSRRRRLVVAAFRVAPHVPFRSGEHSERSVSGAVGEQPALYPDRCVIVHTGRHDGRNGARAGLLDPGDFVAEEKGDVLLGKDGVQLFVIFIDLRRTCIAFGGGPEFVEQVAQRRIFADVQTASETYPDFGGVVAAEYLPVLYEGDFHPPLAAAIAAHMPATPPPATTSPNSPLSSGISGSRISRLRRTKSPSSESSGR